MNSDGQSPSTPTCYRVILTAIPCLLPWTIHPELVSLFSYSSVYKPAVLSGCSLGLLVFWLAPGCLAPPGSLLSPLPSSHSSAGHAHPEFFQTPLPLPVLSLLSIIKKLNPLGAIKSSSYLFSSLSGEECCEFCLQDMTGLSHSCTHRSYGYLFKAWVRTNLQKSLHRWGRTPLTITSSEELWAVGSFWRRSGF